jgi:hypothetical protein
MFGRFDKLEYITQLDPQTDYEEIVYIVGAYESPWLMKKALEFALFRTYAVPHTSRILRATGQFGAHGQKRYDDTTLMLAGIAEKGIDSDYSQIVIHKMNALHGRYNLRNADMLYVLSTFMLEPTRWAKRFGWRQPHRIEQEANFYFWREVGIRMGIQDIPETLEAVDAFNIAHERETYAYDDANAFIGEATMQVFLSWYPALIQPLVRQFLYALMDDPLLHAMGFEKPHAIVRWAAQAGLKARAWFVRLMPPRRQPYHYTEVPNRTYTAGFKPEELGARPIDHP